MIFSVWMSHWMAVVMDTMNGGWLVDRVMTRLFLSSVFKLALFTK